ncbi:MAG: hypothetical protein JKX95_07720 [Bacteroidia bacterium]|nr:hypothetical protein [Bacteroidia bacterium]
MEKRHDYGMLVFFFGASLGFFIYGWYTDHYYLMWIWFIGWGGRYLVNKYIRKDDEADD